MGWRRVAGEWLLFYDHPKRHGARWLPDDDPTIRWKNCGKPIYPGYTVDEHELALNIVATRGAIRGFEYMIASTGRHFPIVYFRRSSHMLRLLRLVDRVGGEHTSEIIRRYNLGTSFLEPAQFGPCCTYELRNRVEPVGPHKPRW